VATDHTTAGVIPEHTRGQHPIHGAELRRVERVTHIQGLRDPEDAEESRLLARKRRRERTAQTELLRLLQRARSQAPDQVSQHFP